MGLFYKKYSEVLLSANLLLTLDTTYVLIYCDTNCIVLQQEYQAKIKAMVEAYASSVYVLTSFIYQIM